MPKVAPAAKTTPAEKSSVKEVPAKSSSATQTSTKPTATKETDTKPKEKTTDTPARAATPTPAPVQEERRSIFLPLVLGGLVAGGVGWAAGQYNWLGQQGADNGLEAAIAAQGDRVTALENVEPVVIPEVDLSSVDALSTKVDGLSETLADFEARLAIVEQRPAPDGGPSIADQTAFQKELQALQASAEAQRAEIAALLENAQSVEQATAAAAKGANIQSAVSQITTALSTGEPFESTLTMLADNGVTDVPAALTDVAADGVETLGNLQNRFPDTARAALGAARTSGAMEGETGVAGFFKRQLGARSTAPREGSDPDAVLSRVEAAVREGSLDTALTEIDTLPEDVQSVMQDWLVDARARSAAQLATQDLSQSLPAN